MPEQSHVVILLTNERAKVADRLAALDAAIKAITGAAPKTARGRKAGWKMSAEARAKISKAAKARWAKLKK